VVEVGAAPSLLFVVAVIRRRIGWSDNGVAGGFRFDLQNRLRARREVGFLTTETLLYAIDHQAGFAKAAVEAAQCPVRRDSLRESSICPACYSTTCG
jgi:hypothetical protein